ncbi:MAG: YfcE family phosphodiesterase [bacterium]|nr:YfcE family phosphodiesterase [bacterium]
MRLLVMSDSHSRLSVMERIIESQPDAKDIFFLGDGIAQAEQLEYIYSDRKFYFVSGNCDFSSTQKTTDFITLAQNKIMFTHGHEYSVKRSIDKLVETAKCNKVKIVLYGHTHCAYTGYFGGIHVVNPGSVSRGVDGKCTYAVIDITDKGIIPLIITI